MKNNIAGAIALTLVCGVAQAALWNSAWSGSTYRSVSDDVGDAGDIATLDITRLEAIYGTDTSGTGYYFRMTLASGGILGSSYMLNFNTDGDLNTGANANISSHVATGLYGIDQIVDTHYDGGSLAGCHNHNFDSQRGDTLLFDGVNLGAIGGARSEAGNSLEWFIPSTELNPNATVRGSVVNLGIALTGDNASKTFDITDTFAVAPEPTSMALLALGLAALGMRRKIGT